MSLAQVSFTLSGEPGHDLHRHLRPFGNRRVVGKASLSSTMGLFMRGIDRPVGEALRRLREVEAVARHGLRDDLVGAGALQRFGDRHGGQGGLALADRGNDPVDQRGIDERPCGIVDQHLLRVVLAQGGKPQPHGILARGAAMHDDHPAAVRADRGLEQIAVVGVDRHHDRPYRRMRQEGVERSCDDRPAADAAVLLGAVGRLAGAFAAPGRDDHHGDLCRSIARRDRRPCPWPRSIRPYRGMPAPTRNGRNFHPLAGCVSGTIWLENKQIEGLPGFCACLICVGSQSR